MQLVFGSEVRHNVADVFVLSGDRFGLIVPKF